MKRKHLAKKLCSIALACMLCVPASVSVAAAEGNANAYEDVQNPDAGQNDAGQNGGQDSGVSGDLDAGKDGVSGDLDIGKDGASDNNGDNAGGGNENSGNGATIDGSSSGEGNDGSQEQDTPSSDNERKTVETLTYSAHVQSIGWQKERKDGEMAGTTGRSKRVEAIKIQVKSEPVKSEESSEGTDESKNLAEIATAAQENTDGETTGEDTSEELKGLTGSVEYQAHCQSYGWMSWVKDGAIGGTSGKGKRMEAIKIRLTGELAEKYDIYYKVHSASFGDLGWAKNGQIAGTAGFGKSIEAITIKLVEKTATDKPAQTKRSYLGTNDLGNITYSSHCQSYGWMRNVADGAMSGTKGKGKRMEAIRIYAGTIYDEEGNKIEGSVEYQAYCQSYGWRNWVKDGAVGGSTGKGKRMEAIRIRLTGDLEKKYDVYYKVHCASWGDLGWASNGEIAGTLDTAKAIESIQIKLVDKNSTEKPTSTVSSSIEMNRRGSIEYETYAENVGWTAAKKGPAVSGTTGKSQKIVAVRMRYNKDRYDGGITYRVYLQGSGWQNWVSDGEIAGVEAGDKRIEAIQIKLTGDISKYASVYYSSHIQAYGWLGWAKNGASSGSQNCSYRMEALRATILAKTVSAPGSTSGAFKTTKYNHKIASFTTVSTNNANSTYNMTKALLSFNGRVIKPGQTLSFFGVAGPCGAAQGYRPGGVVGGTAYGGGICQASTTLYGAALRAGLTIVERRNHSVPSTYVPIGQDAMVSYGSSDFKIRNDFNFNVTLKTYVTGKTLHVDIYGGDPGWFDSVQVRSWYTSSNSAAAERIFYKNGKIVKRQALPKSYYY